MTLRRNRLRDLRLRVLLKQVLVLVFIVAIAASFFLGLLRFLEYRLLFLNGAELFGGILSHDVSNVGVFVVLDVLAGWARRSDDELERLTD